MVYRQGQESTKTFDMVDNYIYLHHTNTLIIIPQYPESVSDSMQATFSSSSPIARSAPIFSYSHSGPRSVQVAIRLHRDMMKQINYGKTNIDTELFNVNLRDDYVDVAIRQLQAAALPKYAATQKMVDPPLVSVRWGTDIFCKGVINGAVSTTYSGPIINTTDMYGKKVDKYAIIDVSFNILEVEPYDAETVMQVGGYRGISKTLDRMWRSTNSSSKLAVANTISNSSSIASGGNAYATLN